MAVAKNRNEVLPQHLGVVGLLLQAIHALYTCNKSFLVILLAFVTLVFPTLTLDHELWIVSERMKSQMCIQSQNSFSPSPSPSARGSDFGVEFSSKNEMVEVVGAYDKDASLTPLAFSK